MKRVWVEPPELISSTGSKLRSARWPPASLTLWIIAEADPMEPWPEQRLGGERKAKLTPVAPNYAVGTIKAQRLADQPSKLRDDRLRFDLDHGAPFAEVPDKAVEALSVLCKKKGSGLEGISTGMPPALWIHGASPGAAKYQELMPALTNCEAFAGLFGFARTA